MTSRDFVYWLQGYLELRRADKNSPEHLSFQQVQVIENHLNMVFKHEIDPSFGPPEKVKELSEIHERIKELSKTKPPTEILINC